MNLREVAERAGVSLGTASNVLSGNRTARVSSEKRQHVLDIAKQMGYEPRPRGRRRSQKIAICGEYGQPDDEFKRPPFNAAVTISLIREAVKSAVDLIFLTGTSLQQRRSSPAYYLSQVYDALIAWHVTPAHEETLAEVAKRRDNVVLLFRPPQKHDLCCVTPDNYAIGRVAARELRERGYKRFIHIAGDTADAQERRAGFEKQVNSIDSRLLLPTILPRAGESSWEEPYTTRAVEEIRSHVRASSPLGVFAWCDPLALSLIQEAERKGRLEIPVQVGVLGCDGLNLGKPLLDRVGLSTISLGVEQVASQAIQMAIELIDGPVTERTRVIAKDPQIIPRWSTSCSGTIPRPQMGISK